jgi:hypothetical protein
MRGALPVNDCALIAEHLRSLTTFVTIGILVVT